MAPEALLSRAHSGQPEGFGPDKTGLSRGYCGLAWYGQAPLVRWPCPSVEMQEIGLQLTQLPGYTGDADIHAGSCRLRLPDGDLLSSWLF